MAVSKDDREAIEMIECPNGCGCKVPLSVVEDVIARRTKPQIANTRECPCGTEMDAGGCPNGHDCNATPSTEQLFTRAELDAAVEKAKQETWDAAIKIAHTFVAEVVPPIIGKQSQTANAIAAALTTARGEGE